VPLPLLPPLTPPLNPFTPLYPLQGVKGGKGVKRVKRIEGGIEGGIQVNIVPWAPTLYPPLWGYRVWKLFWKLSYILVLIFIY
jgi:hypothetical protein